MAKSTIIFLFSLLSVSFGFQNIQQQSTRLHLSIHSSQHKLNLAKITENGGSDFPPEEEFSDSYEGSVDWDAEWKKVVASDGAGGAGERPGKDFYKSEAEIAAIKAVNKASEKTVDLATNVSDALPDVRSLSGDWKFWIAILAIVSIGFAVLSAPSNIPTNIPTGGSPDSYYI